MGKRVFSFLNVLLLGSSPSSLNEDNSNIESEFRSKLSLLVNDGKNEQHPVHESIKNSIASLISKYPSRFTSELSNEANFDTYSEIILQNDHDFGIYEANLLGYIAKKSIIVYRKAPDTPIEFNLNEACGGNQLMVYFDGGLSFYLLLDPTKSNLLSNSYFMCMFDHKPFFLAYPLDILKQHLDEYRKSLEKFEKRVNNIQDKIDFSDEKAHEMMSQLDVESLDNILKEQKQNRLGVFYLSRQPNAIEIKQALVGHKIFVIKSDEKGKKFKLGFAHNNRFQTCQLSPKKHRSDLFKGILKNQGLIKSDETANETLFEYFRKNDMICKLEDPRLTQCNNQKFKLFPADANPSGLFAKLKETQDHFKGEFVDLKNDFINFLASKAKLQSVLCDLTDLSRVCQAEKSVNSIEKIVPENGSQLRAREFSEHLRNTRDDLIQLIDSSRLINTNFFMSKLAILLDEKNEVEKWDDNQESIYLAIAAKYSSFNDNREKSFKECFTAINKNFPVLACWIAKCYETGYGVVQNYVQAVKHYETEKSRGDWTGIATVSIENLKSKKIITDSQILKAIGAWYASIGSTEASFWLTEAANSSTFDLGLSFSWGQVHETSKDYEKAMRYYVLALKEDDKKTALEAIENLDKKLISSQHPDLDLEVKSMLEIAEAFETNNRDHINSVVWFIRASKLGSERATRTLRQMTSKNEYRDVQYTLGEYFEATNDLERATKCYKKMSPANVNAPDEEVRIPWKSEEDDEEGVEAIDDSANREFTNEEFTGDAYLPVEKLKPISIFYQASIEFALADRRKEMKKGIYCGTLSGLELRPNGLGEWKFDDKEKDQEVRYRGEWQNGRWHGLGDLYETTQNKSSKISVEISKGRFANGRLMAEDGTSDAHITINKTLSDGVIIEVHIYGQMKETEHTRTLLGFLSNNIFAKHYYFHSETMRTRFRRLVQIHVVSSQMGRPDGYEIVGNWIGESNGTYEMSQLVRNEFDEEKTKLVERLNDEIKKFLFKSELDSRYALLGFYVKILASETTIEELVSRILAEKDDRICPKSFRKLATSLSDLIKIRNEVKEYIKMDKDTSTSARLRDDIDEYVRTRYFEWLQDFGKCDPIPSGNMSTVSILLIDPNVLNMLTQVRERIACVWGLNVNFELAKTLEQLANPELVVNFQSAWRNLYKSEEKLRKLAGMGDKFYPNGWSDFERRCEEVQTVCDRYVRFVDELVGVLVRVRNAKSVGKTSRANAFGLFYKFYSELFSFELHLDSSMQLVDYQQKSEQYAAAILKSDVIKSSLKCVQLDEILAGFVPDSTTGINFLLNLLEYVFSIDEIMMMKTSDEQDNDHEQDADAKSLVGSQVKFLTTLRNKPTIETDRVVNVFVQYLSTYTTTVRKWTTLFSPFENISLSLGQIKRVLISCIDYLLSIADQIDDNNYLIIICDLLEEQKNLIANIDFLPLYVTESSFFSWQGLRKRIGLKTNRIELDEPEKVVEYLDSQLKREKQKSDEQAPVEEFGRTTRVEFEVKETIENENEEEDDDEEADESEEANKLETKEDREKESVEEDKQIILIKGEDKTLEKIEKQDENNEKEENQIQNKTKKDKKKKNKKKEETKKLLARHHSYDLLSRALEILSSRIYKFKETITTSPSDEDSGPKLDDMLTMIEKYFDVVGELVKQLDHQLDAQNLDQYVDEKAKLFERCRSFGKLDDLNEYLTALKRFVVVTAGTGGGADESSRRFSKNSECVAEILRLNPRFGDDRSREFFVKLLEEYAEEFKDFQLKFTKNELNLKQIVDELAEIKDVESNDVRKQVVRLVAGVAWLQTVQMSKLADSSGFYIGQDVESTCFELSPSFLHVLECLCLLFPVAGTKSAASQSVKSYLSSATRRIAEIPDEQSKSAVVCLLAVIYALMDFEVTIVCHNEFLVSRDEEDMQASFGKILGNQLGSIRFLTLTDLIRGRIDPTGNPSETPSKLIEQLVFNGAYESDFGATKDENATVASSSRTRESLLIFEEVDTIVSVNRLEEFNEPMKLITCKELGNGVRVVYKMAKQVANRFIVIDEKKSMSKEKKNMAALERFQMTVKRNMAMTKFKSAVNENESLARFINANPNLFDEYCNELWTCALQVANLYSDHERNQEKSRRELREFLDEDDESNDIFEPLFRLSRDGSRCEYYYKNKWTSTVYPRYLNSFFYLELFSHQSQFIEPDVRAFGYMKLSCGPVYSSCLIDKITTTISDSVLVFGLSSCLKSQASTRDWLLSPAEKSMLNELVLKAPTSERLDESFLFFPSFVEQTVAFDATKAKSFDILLNRYEWMKRICQTCESLSKANKTVLVFFRNEKDLKLAYEKLIIYEPFLLTNNEISINRFGDRKISGNEFFEHNDQELFEWAESICRLTTEHCSGQPGKITLLMSDYARGIDFECNSVVSKSGGLHIVQTWFSEDPKEEVQVRARTARDCAPTVFIQILNLEDLERVFKQTAKTIHLSRESSYEILRKLSKTFEDTKYSRIRNEMKIHQEKSNKVLDWLEKVRKDRARYIDASQDTNKEVDHKLIDEYATLPR